MNDLGVQQLIEHLAAITGETVYLWHTPDSSPDEWLWRVWTGPPCGTGGGEWGHGSTPFAALHAAFGNVVRAIFEERLTPPTARG